MALITFVDGIRQEGFLGQFPSSFELHPYYDGREVVSFDIRFEDDEVNQSFHDFCVEHFPDCYIHMFDDGTCEVREDLLFDSDDDWIM